MKATTLRWDDGWRDDLWAAAAEFNSDHTAVLVFADRRIDQVPIDELAAAFGDSTVVGCSTAGQIAAGDLVEEPLVALVLQLAGAQPCAVGITVTGGEDSRQAGERLAGDLLTATSGEVGAVLVFSDGLHVNGSDLVAGLLSRLPAGTGVSGGLAGDGSEFGVTWVLHGSTRWEHGLVALALPGTVATHGTGGGWEGFGPHRIVTRSEGNVLLELDHRPALELYRDYLGDLAAGLPGSALMFPLAIESDSETPSLVRTVLAVDEDARTMTFAGDIPQGSVVRLMRTTKDRLVDAASRAARQSVQQDTSSVSIAVSCVGRRLVLGERTGEELEAVTESLGDGDHVVGFYSYGEISSAAGFCGLYNQTMTITTISEPSNYRDGPDG
ncbi:MAG: FIST C-terminal domain-containing protein [Actinobacteria bacterium]|nr:FIST C-terminal domain-containing protein [Actinomycetota bacterium]